MDPTKVKKAAASVLEAPSGLVSKEKNANTATAKKMTHANREKFGTKLSLFKITPIREWQLKEFKAIALGTGVKTHGAER